MPKLTKPEHLAALTAEVAKPEYDGLPIREIAAALNAPEVIGHETGHIETAAAYEAISPDTLLALDEAAGGDGDAAGEALWFISAISDVEPLSLASGSAGRSTLTTLTEAGLIPDAEAVALVAAAQVDVLGQSPGQALGIGRIYPEFVTEAKS